MVEFGRYLEKRPDYRALALAGVRGEALEKLKFDDEEEEELIVVTGFNAIGGSSEGFRGNGGVGGVMAAAGVWLTGCREVSSTIRKGQSLDES